LLSKKELWGSTDWASTYKILTFKYCKGGCFLLKILHAEIVTRISIEMKNISLCSVTVRYMLGKWLDHVVRMGVERAARMILL